MKITEKHVQLAALLLFSAAAILSCGNETQSQANIASETGSAASAEESESAAETEEVIADSVPELDFGGASFRISINDYFTDEFDTDELTGEITNDAVYSRNQLIEERFNVTIETVVTPGAASGNHASHIQYVQKCVLAGEDAFDLAGVMTYTVGTGILNGCFMNWYDIPYVDLDNAWWAHNINSAFTVDGKLYTAVSDMCVTSMQLTYAYLFNKDLAQDYCDESLYDVVESGRWTLDYLYDLTKDLYHDTNGDGTQDAGDFYGLITDTVTSIDCYFPCCGQKLLETTEDGFTILMETERAVGIYEKVDLLVNENPGAFRIYHGVNGQLYDDKYTLFSANQGLLMPVRLIALYDELRDMKSDFGILPFPKYDEEQSEYYSAALDDYSLLCVPVTAGNVEMVGALVESLSAESKRTVMPAYYQSALQDKYSRDEKSVEMLDLIMDGRSYDVSILFGSSMADLPYFVRNCISSQKEYVSSLEKKMPTFEKKTAEVFEKIKALS